MKLSKVFTTVVALGGLGLVGLGSYKGSSAMIATIQIDALQAYTDAKAREAASHVQMRRTFNSGNIKAKALAEERNKDATAAVLSFLGSAPLLMLTAARLRKQAAV